MSAGPIGEAHILITPDLRGFGARLKTELNAAVRANKTPAVKIQFDIHKGSLQKAIVEANRILKTSGVKAKIEFDLSRGSLNRSLLQARAAARAAGIKAKVDVDDAGSIRRTTRGLDLLGGRGRSALRSLNREVFNSNIRLREMANILGGATLPVLVSLASVGIAAFGSLTSAIVSAAAAAATLPNFLAAAVQALGVGALAFGGLGAAVKAMGQAQDKAGASALSAARKDNTAAEQIKAAQRGVRDALRGVRDAQLDLNAARVEARQRLADLRLEEVRLSLDLRGASLSIREAEAELTKVNTDSGASELEQRKAQLAVEQALANQRRVNTDLRSTELDKARAQLAVDEARGRQQQLDPGPSNLDRQRAKLRLEEARQGRTEVQRRIALNRQEIRSGVEGSDQVVAAKERQRDAARSLSDAQEGLAKASRSAALSTAAAAAPVAKLTTAMDNLSPAAQRFARFLFSLKPRLDELRAAAAAGLFPGLESALRTLIGGLFPTFRTIVDQTARAMGGLAREGAAMLASGPFRRDFAQLGRDNVQIIRDAGHSSLNLVDALRNLIAAARPLTLSISAMVLGWTENVRASAAAGRESGKLTRFFQAAGESLRSLARIAGNVGATIAAVLTAAFPSGAGLLVSLEEATGKMRELATSSEGLRKMREFFDKAKPAVETIAGLFVVLARKIFEVVVHVKSVTEAIAGFLDEHPELKDMLGTVLALVLAFKAFNVAGLLGAVGAIGQLVAFNPLLALVIGSVLAIGGAFLFAYNHSKPFHDTVDKLGRSIKETVGPALKSFGGFIRDDVLPALKRAAPFIKDQLVKGLDFLFQAIQDNKPELQTLGRLLLAIGKFIAVTVIPAIFKLTSVHLRALFTSFGIIIGVIGVLVRVFKAMVSGILFGFQTILNAAATAFGWMPGIGPKLKAARDKFKEFAKGVNNALDGIPNKNVIVTARGVFKAPKGIVQLPGGGGDFSTKANNRARGGPIFGPGTGTSDDVPIWASHGEHMWTAAEVRKAGGHQVMEAWRRSIRGYASGGAVEDARPGRFRVTPRLSSSALEEGLATFGSNVDRFALALGKNLGASMFGSGGGSASGAISGAKFGGGPMAYIAKFLREAGVMFKIISGFRPGARTRGTGSVSLHALGRALDLVGAGNSSMLDIWRAATRIPFKKEVIFSPAPFQVYGSGKHPGPPSNPITRADHYNHVHVGLFDKGGFLMPGLTLAHNRTGRPEKVTPATRDAAGRLSFGGQGTHIENLIVQPLSGQFRLRDVMTELRLQGVH